MARERKFTTEELFHTTRKLLLQHGYEGFTFSNLAKHMHVSRGAIYKYFNNKDELISSYMIFEMEQFLHNLHKIHTYKTFEAQFDYLMKIILKDQAVLQIREISFEIPTNKNKKVAENIKQIEKLHLDMYAYLKEFIKLGREEEIIHPQLPDSLILGFIFQSVSIPNHFQVPREEWIESIIKVLCHGIFIKR